MPASDMAAFGKNLPTSVHKKGFEVRTFMPKYGAVNERRNQLHEVIRLSGVNIIIDDNDHPLIIKVASMQPSRIQVYFVDNDDYFQKLDTDQDPVGSNRTDNDERAIFYARGTMDTAKKLRWDPDLIHVSGIASALTPLYMKQNYGKDPSFAKTKVIYSVTPGEFSAPIDERIFYKLRCDGIDPAILERVEGSELNASLLHKLAILSSDAVIFHVQEPEPEVTAEDEAPAQEEALTQEEAENIEPEAVDPYDLVDPELKALVEELGLPCMVAPLLPVEGPTYIEFYNNLLANENNK